MNENKQKKIKRNLEKRIKKLTKVNDLNVVRKEKKSVRTNSWELYRCAGL
jgi:hypothetical protein